jgi:hypothetical protein
MLNEAQRIAFHRAELDSDLKIPQAERDCWVLGSIQYHTECLIHLGALPKPPKPTKIQPPNRHP